MPYFLSNSMTAAITTDEQSVSGMKPILTSFFSGASEPAAQAPVRTAFGTRLMIPAAPAALINVRFFISSPKKTSDTLRCRTSLSVIRAHLCALQLLIRNLHATLDSLINKDIFQSMVHCIGAQALLMHQ